LWRLRGELLVQRDGSGDVEEAERCFGLALDLAVGRKALSWQLRAATSLAGLWHRQGRDNEARALLLGPYTAFTEGHDTADLVRAKALLDALVAAGPPVELNSTRPHPPADMAADP
jgi:predicted ATPase